MKILFWGLGSIGQRHARNIRKLFGGQHDLMACRTRGLNDVITAQLTIDPSARIEKEYDIRCLKDPASALAEKPDVAFITNPNHLHAETALLSAAANCHLFIEKPVAHSLAGLARLQQLIRERGLTCLVAYQMRFHPGLRLLRQILQAGTIGPVVGGRQAFGEFLPGWHPYEDYRLYHAARPDQGGGVLLSQIHDLDLLQSLFGIPKRVCCFGGTLSGLGLEVEDTASVLLEFVDAEGRKFPFHLHQDYSQKPPQRLLEIVGTRGKLVWDYFAAEMVVTTHDDTGNAVHSFKDFQRNQLFEAELTHFFDCLAGQATPEVDLQTGIGSLRIALAARASLAEGRIVDLGEIVP